MAGDQKHQCSEWKMPGDAVPIKSLDTRTHSQGLLIILTILYVRSILETLYTIK